MTMCVENWREKNDNNDENIRFRQHRPHPPRPGINANRIFNFTNLTRQSCSISITNQSFGFDENYDDMQTQTVESNIIGI